MKQAAKERRGRDVADCVREIPAATFRENLQVDVWPWYLVMRHMDRRGTSGALC